MKHLGLAAALGLAALLGGAASAVPQDARPERIDFGAFLKREAKLNGARVQMHAMFVGATPSYVGTVYDAAWFKQQGYDELSHFAFSVAFPGQTASRIHPRVLRSPSGKELWKQLEALEMGARLTLTGELTKLTPSSDPAAGAVPWVLLVEEAIPGYVLSYTEYVTNLGAEGPLAEETIELLLRSGDGVHRPLAGVVAGSKYSERQRVNAARCLARSGNTRVLGKLTGVVKFAKTPKAVRFAALRAIGAIKPASAAKLVAGMLTAKKPDPWGIEAAAEVLQAGVIKVPDLARAVGKGWAAARDAVAESIRERGHQALARRQGREAVAAATAGLDLAPDSGELMLLRGKGFLACPDLSPQEEVDAAQDLAEAAKRGAAPVATLVLLAREAVRAKRGVLAQAIARNILATDPTNADARALRAELLLAEAASLEAAGKRRAALRAADEAVKLTNGDFETRAARARIFKLSTEMLNAKQITCGKFTLRAPKDWSSVMDRMPPDPKLVGVMSRRTVVLPGETVGELVQIFIRTTNPGPNGDPRAWLDQHKAGNSRINWVDQGTWTSVDGVRYEWISSTYPRKGREPPYRVITCAHVVDGRWLWIKFRLGERIWKDHVQTAWEMVASLQWR